MSNDLLTAVEISRIIAREHISEEKKKLAEQYFTPARVSKIMASMFSCRRGSSLNVLDPCAGVGNLAAAVFELGKENGENQKLTLVESDAFLYDKSVLNFSSISCADIINASFFDIFGMLGEFDRVIINPPYSKLSPTSPIAKLCKELLDYSDHNLYSIFISFCLQLLSPHGELVAVVPRSFCNGPLFRGFRRHVSDRYFFNEFYLFESRKIFGDSNVKQEVIILKISRHKTQVIRISHEKKNGEVVILHSTPDRVTFPHDPNQVIHIPLAQGDDTLLSKISRFPSTLESIGLKTSTGKVVDFRCNDKLRTKKTKFSVNLIYQDCVKTSELAQLETSSKRPKYIISSKETLSLLLPKDNYILIRRISFKESATRIVASPLLRSQFKNDHIGIENHLNYIWKTDGEMTLGVCLGLYAYLSTETVDKYVRRFSGHTQINAADIDSLPVPKTEDLEEFYKKNTNLSLLELTLAAEIYFFGESK